MNASDLLSNLSPDAIENYYKIYLKDPQSLDPQWLYFFKGFELARTDYKTVDNGHGFSTKEFNVVNLINAYRQRGHLFTNTNPVRKRRKYTPTLDLEVFNLSSADLNTTFKSGELLGIGAAKLSVIIDHLKVTYCNSIGVEYLYIRDPRELEWLRSRMESSRNTPEFSIKDKLHIHQHLVEAVGFERFIHNRFTGQKRFSLEGSENLIPALDTLIEHGAALGIKEFVIGMSHRGRLNVLANILKKPYELIFREFTGKSYFDNISLGDVKYHLGYNNEVLTDANCKVKLHLAPNPSHLEAVAPVVQGIAHAISFDHYKGNPKQVLPILIHGDAAIAGQGVVYEVVQMAGLEGYSNGGTIHMVINNQVGFTTDYLQARTSTYCTDVAKVTRCPVFHVNGDDVEALLYVVKLALDYRQEFSKDVFIDILSYRKYGHNEGDEPRFTQPLLYKAIEQHANPLEIYTQFLIEQKVASSENLFSSVKQFDQLLDEQLNEAKKHSRVYIQPFLGELWSSFRNSHNADFFTSISTGIDLLLLDELSEKLTQLPDPDSFFRKAVKLMEDRKIMLKSNRFDWALGEALAFASLISEGIPLRLSGQDSQRGTFSHRHAALIRETDGSAYFQLKNISNDQACIILNSPLNEYGVMGFEYGYALASPKSLTIWEAQFGDFSNVAQVIIDQYISAAEEKWGLMNGLVLLLPHGYEGQGPEHSSARIERFLTLAANNNMQILNLSTPANLFHALRQQVKREFRVPMIIFTPKSLLRHPKAVSVANDFTQGTFNRVIDDNANEPSIVSRVVFCTGKMYYDLLAKKEELNANDIALVRIEQLYPLPLKEIELVLAKYPNRKNILWVQEEPANMGALPFIQRNLGQFNIQGIARQDSGSPAVGLHEIHQKQQEEIIGKVFKKCTCSLNLRYCGLQCESGHYQEPILNNTPILSKINMVEIKIPSPGESISEVTLLKWFVKNSQWVEKNQELAELESDKATLTLTAPVSGQISIQISEGSAVAVGSIACFIDETIQPEKVVIAFDDTTSSKKVPKDEVVSEQIENSEEKLLKITPLARKIMQVNNLTEKEVLDKIQRISANDIIKLMDKSDLQNDNAVVSTERQPKRVPMSALRKKLSQRLVQVKNETAMLTTFNEVDMSAIIKLRERYKVDFEKQFGYKLGYMSFFTKAASLALQAFPNINSMIDGDDIVQFNYTDIGIAVQTPKGLMVPVVRNVQTKKIPQVEAEIAQLAQKARDSKISLDELSGGTFSITNGGVFGSMFSTPILNPPQAAILGMHAILDRPVAINGQVVIRPMMYLALSYDHRLVDGKDSVSFLVRIKEIIEHPERLLSNGEEIGKALLF